MDLKECQICWELKECEPVSCNSNVPHDLCGECESKCRQACRQAGKDEMTCPTCRQPETCQSTKSLQREIESLRQEISLRQPKTLTELAQAADDLVVQARRITRTLETIPEITFIEGAAGRVREIASSAVARAALPTRDARVRRRCASGRCTSTSPTGRAMTYLKCNICNTVFCCRTCKECVNCRP